MGAKRLQPRWFTSRASHGNQRDRKRRGQFLKQKHLPDQLAHARQVHGTDIQIISSLTDLKEYQGVDGFLTDVPGLPLGIFTADCFPIFLSAPKQGVVGALHAGWRGVQKGILKKAVRLMGKRWRAQPREIEAWVGPGIRSCCFKVQWDVARYFPTVRRKKTDGWRVDLPAALAQQAKGLGIRWKTAPNACTVHHPDFFSYRRDKTDDRLLSVMMKTDERT